MNGLYSDPDLHKALAQQNFERLLAESEKDRLIKIASREKAKQKEIEGFTLGQLIKTISGRITQSVSSLLLALKTKNDTLNI
jgi:hypothetical protein